MQKLLRDGYICSDIFEHIETKTCLSIDSMNKIDWENHGTALGHQQLFIKVRLVKFMNNWLNTGHQKKLMDDNAVHACSICLDTEEI
eukprot:2105611-Ditylum_brightwellii.AAC.1